MSSNESAVATVVNDEVSSYSPASDAGHSSSVLDVDQFLLELDSHIYLSEIANTSARVEASQQFRRSLQYNAHFLPYSCVPEPYVHRELYYGDAAEPVDREASHDIHMETYRQHVTMKPKEDRTIYPEQFSKPRKPLRVRAARRIINYLTGRSDQEGN